MIKFLYKVTMEIEGDPNAAVENIKWNNNTDEVYGILFLNISRYLLFHLDGYSSPDELWETIQNLFGNTDKMRGHQLENELIALIPRSFEYLQVYLSKFKSLFLQLKQHGIDKEDEQLVLDILSKLGPN